MSGRGEPRRYVVRVWVPDRPGALGAVASRIGAARGDVIGIDILERGGGRAIDELVVELPDESLLPLMLQEIAEVDGADVEEVHAVTEWSHDPRIDALQSAAVLVEQSTRDALVTTLVEHVCRDFDAAWAAIVDREGSVLAGVGEVPEGRWIAAFVAGSESSEHASSGAAGPDDVAWAAIDDVAAVAMGRHGVPFRGRERMQLVALAHIAGIRWRQLA